MFLLLLYYDISLTSDFNKPLSIAGKLIKWSVHYSFLPQLGKAIQVLDGPILSQLVLTILTELLELCNHV